MGSSQTDVGWRPKTGLPILKIWEKGDVRSLLNDTSELPLETIMQKNGLKG